MIKQFVFDTNSLISAHLIRLSVNRKAYEQGMKTGIVLHSAETIREFAEVFVQSKFDKYISLDARIAALDEFEKRSLLIRVTKRIKACRDPKDDKFLALAVEAGADCIITGDKDLLVLHPFKKVAVLSAADFIKKF